MSRIKQGVVGIGGQDDPWIGVVVKSLRDSHGFYFKGPHIIGLEVSGGHSGGCVHLTAEAAQMLIQALQKVIEDEPR